MEIAEDRNDDDSHVRLLVKAPDQQIDDQLVIGRLDWTVLMLKQHLADVYPGKPKHTEQKIIFSGQLLSDAMILKDVLQHYYSREDKSYIVHLVYRGKSNVSLGSKVRGSNMAVNSNTNESNVNVPSPASSVPSPPQLTPVEQYYSQLTNQQMAWIQQAYANYLELYTQQFMAPQGIQLQSTSPHGRLLNTAATRASDAANNNNAIIYNNNQENDDEEAHEARIAAAAANANNINNNNNNNNNVPADDAQGALNRDWLDIFDMLSKIVVLSSIVYFYSSPSRFLIVTFLGFAVYLIQGGFFRGQPMFLPENVNARLENNNQGAPNEARVPPVPPAAAAAAAPVAPTPAAANPPETSSQHSTTPPQPAAQVPQEAENTPSATAEAASTPVEGARTNVNEVNERPGALAFTWTFFSSFFASLIPDQPNVI